MKNMTKVSMLILAVSLATSLNAQLTIRGARVVTPPMNPLPGCGDLWMNTWAEDDLLYSAWGDGNGPWPGIGCDAGVAVLRGNPPFFVVPDDSTDIRCKFVPDGTPTSIRDDKPSSLISIDGVLYFAGHSPLGDAEYGYIAVSTDDGATWAEIPHSPWQRFAGSPFRCMFFINMGQNYELNTDGYVYSLAIGKEWAWWIGEVYLNRVSVDSIIDYTAYTYFAGFLPDSEPLWSFDQADAAPLEGLYSHQMGSAMFHQGIDRFLFLTIDNLYEAENPWGPWREVASILSSGSDPEWDGGYMPGIISKNIGPDYFYFTLSGQDSIIGYNLHVGKIGFALESAFEVDVAADVTVGNPPLNVTFTASPGAGAFPPFRYRWFFAYNDTSTLNPTSHTYGESCFGKYRAMVKVTDSLGNIGYGTKEIIVAGCGLSHRPSESFTYPIYGVSIKYFDLPPRIVDTLPVFSPLTPFRTDTIDVIDFYPADTCFGNSDCKDSVGALLEGYILAPETGVYSFYMIATGIAEFSIGDDTLSEILGYRGGLRESPGQIALEAGWHPFVIAYAKNCTTHIDSTRTKPAHGALRLFWEGPNFAMRLIPDSAFAVGVFVGITETPTPQSFALSVYPNPFNSAVKISVESPVGEGLRPARVEVFDIAGRHVAQLLSPSVPLPEGEGGNSFSLWEKVSEGRMRAEFTWQPEKSIGSGVYLVRVRFGDRETTKRVVYLK